MTNEELLKVAASVLRDAIFEAEFSHLAKDVAYAQMVANKVERLRAGIAGRLPVKLTLVLIGNHMVVEYAAGWQRHE